MAANLGLSAEDVVIERKTDLMTEIETLTAKSDSNGVAMTIGTSKGRTVDPDDDELDMELTLTIQLWVQTLYNPDAKPEEDISEDLMRLLHGLKLGDNDHYYRELRVTGFDDVADPDFLLREIYLKQRTVF